LAGQFSGVLFKALWGSSTHADISGVFSESVGLTTEQRPDRCRKRGRPSSFANDVVFVVTSLWKNAEQEVVLPFCLGRRGPLV
jgi:hypothetical protein